VISFLSLLPLLRHETKSGQGENRGILILAHAPHFEPHRTPHIEILGNDIEPEPESDDSLFYLSYIWINFVGSIERYSSKFISTHSLL
jgi:hypothetical protein